MQDMWETWVRSLGREDPLEEKWPSNLVFLPGESHEERSLVGYSPWGHTVSDTTEAAWHAHIYLNNPLHLIHTSEAGFCFSNEILSPTNFFFLRKDLRVSEP